MSSRPTFPGLASQIWPGRDKFHYTFNNIAHVIDRFTEMLV
jgi:hypothetical protein